MTIAISGTTGITLDGQFNSASTFGFKNRIINGAMVIDQRNAGASTTVTANGYYSCDRWQTYSSQSSKYSIQQNAGSVTPPSGFSNYIGVTSLSAYSITSTDYFVLLQKIEGYNIADFAWGTASASTITLSFWVRSSLTGTFGGALRGGTGEGRSYPFTYTISASNTWEQKSITIVGDTTSTWSSTNTSGVQVQFGLGVGSTYSGTAGSWQASGLNSATGATSVVGTNGATFYITGVQLEKGSTATSFDYRPYGTELALCQRYYYKIQADDASYLFGAGGATSATAGVFMGVYPVTLRTTPSALEQNGTAAHYTVQTGGVDRASSAVVALQSITTQNAWAVTTTVASGQTAGLSGFLYGQNVAAYLGWSAEL